MRSIKCGRYLVLFAALGLAFAPLKAQQTKSESQDDNTVERRTDYNNRTRPNNRETSALEKENLARVAASAAQIREVLIKDPGLMVELKRWIATDASDNGQIVSDESLTDDAVFDRLTNDLAFRSVATRLVQRYGYLRPGVNPDSDMGKEQELLIKERVRRLVQIESEEDAESTKPKKRETNETSVVVPCESSDDRE
jgi:hypothetical protein